MGGALVPLAMGAGGAAIGALSGNSFGPKNISTTPKEVAGASQQAGQVAEGVFQGGSFADSASRIASGINPQGFDITSAANALLNPDAYDASQWFGAQKGERQRQTQDAYGQAATYAGSSGNRFGAGQGGMNRLAADTMGQLGEGWARADAEMAMADLGRMDQARGMGLQGAAQQQGLLAPFMQMLLQFVQPQNVFDQGMGRSVAEGFMGNAMDIGGLMGADKAIPGLFG